MSSERSLSKDRSPSKDRSCSKERPNKGGERRSRKTSVSLEDLTTLSNFNSNYYSLDFSPNSPRKQLLSDSRVDNQNEGNSLVNECRKIEASLRALSSGCLVKKDTQNMSLSNEDIDRINSDTKKCQHGSLENLNNSSKRAKFPGRSERLKVNSPVSSSEESLNSSPYHTSAKYSDKVSPLCLRPFKDFEIPRVPVSRNLSTEDILQNSSPGSRSPIDIYLDDDDDVFFASSDNVASNKHKRTPAKNKFPDPVVDVFDQVDVQFKPDRPNSVFKLKTKQKESKENEKSVFGLLKSKVFQIFSRDNDDIGAKDVKTNLVNSKLMPKVNNHVKETSMTPELPNDLKNMAKELNFKVREFPLSSCLELPKDPGSPKSPRSPKFRLKFDLGGESLENSLVSPQRLKQFSFRQDSVEQYVKSPRGSRKFKRSDSFEKRIISPRSDMKLQLQRTNSGNDLRKSAILNRTKQSSPTLEQSRSNPFIVRSFSSDYVEDPSTEYPFKNMKENGSEEIHVESPTEVLSVEQTLYDCFIKIDLDKVNGYTGNRSYRGSIDSEISVDSLDFDDRLEFGETLYNDEGINMVVNDADELNRNVNRCTERVNGRQESQGNNKRDSSGNGVDCTNEHREKRMVANGDERNISDNTELRFSDTNTVSSENEFSRKKKGSYKGIESKAKSLNKTMLTKDVCNANTNNERTNKADEGDGNICDNETLGRIRQSEIPDVSCVGKEGKVSTKLCRYYHVFREGELEKLISSHIKDLHIVQCFYDHANWCLVAVKVDKD